VKKQDTAKLFNNEKKLNFNNMDYNKMKWFFKCPVCGEWEETQWIKRNCLYECPTMKKIYYPPSPLEQIDAYVDTKHYPREIEEAVIKLKGRICTAPDCRNHYTLLIHKVPLSKGGTTSVENLIPVCYEHAITFSEDEYNLSYIFQYFKNA
jgi:hypothetical protein